MFQLDPIKKSYDEELLNVSDIFKYIKILNNIGFFKENIKNKIKFLVISQI